MMVSTWTLSAHALLSTRLGGLAVYDNDLDLAWIADGNAGPGSTFDDGFNPTDGRMTWQNANDWAASLTVSGVTGWRLPTTTQPDPTCAVIFGCTGIEYAPEVPFYCEARVEYPAACSVVKKVLWIGSWVI